MLNPSTNGGKTDCYWLSSPSNYQATVCANSSTSISRFNYLAKYSGFRPIICLKANTKIIDLDNDGMYEVQNN